MFPAQLKITEDGSHTLYLPAIDECYHSTHGAVQESKHIFVENGLMSVDKETINILEIGFGTGLNAFLTLIEAEKHTKKIKYTAIELYPVDINKVLSLNYPALVEGNKKRFEFEKLHQTTWGQWVELSPNFSIKKIKKDLLRFISEDTYDVVYFDAFSPDKQPEMWTERVFQNLYQHVEQNGVLVTYSCKGIVKRALKVAGFTVEKLPGPVGKREILKAIK